MSRWSSLATANRRAFSYIDDVAPVIARSILLPEAYNQVFNVGGDTMYTVNELAQAVCRAMGVDAEIRHVPARNEVKHAYADHEKARSTFDLPDPIPLDAGLARMAAWAKQVWEQKDE
ncbi:MAG: hypothetical protein IPK16_22875 [Anaerolineales bacterium]|nr:hypothetical protein [Anaerolineales bacterium]